MDRKDVSHGTGSTSGDEGAAGAASGPPVPVMDKWLGTVGKTMIAVGLGGITFFAIVAAEPHRTHGAPASARLELQRRRVEIESAMAEAGRARREPERETARE